MVENLVGLTLLKRKWSVGLTLLKNYIVSIARSSREKSEHLPLVLSVHVLFILLWLRLHPIYCILYIVYCTYIVYCISRQMENNKLIICFGQHRPKYSILAARGLRYNKLYKQYIQYTVHC